MKISKHLFFCEDIDSHCLSKEESHHALKVLRLSVGDPIKVMDGKGTIAEAIITDTSKTKTLFDILNKENSAPPKKKIHIAIGPTKTNERMAFFLEKCTEIGISSFTPLISKNSERKKINAERWQKIIVSAAKQSQTAIFPTLNKIESFNDFVGKTRKGDLRIAHCNDNFEKTALKNSISDNNDIVILIGPEGDFTEEEIKFALQNEYKSVSLGKTRLRTETAGIIACHTVNLLI